MVSVTQKARWCQKLLTRIAKAQAKGGSGELVPRNTATRAQTAEVLTRFVGG